MPVSFVDKIICSDSDLKKTKIEGKVAYKGIFFDVQRDKVRLPNNHISEREYIKHPGAVVVLPILDDGTILLERQFRYPLNQVFIEFPAGKLDANEEPLLCAQRELKEETGYTASDWQFVCIIHNAVGYSDECLHLYLARGLKAGEKKLDEDELVETFSIDISQLLGWVKEGKITDVKTVIGTFWLEKITAGLWTV